MSVYLVTGRHAYREHQPGETFEALLDLDAEQRAIERGDISVIEESRPGLKPGSYTLPAGWANTRA